MTSPATSAPAASAPKAPARAERTLASTAVALVRSMRPRQWPKNGVLLVGLIFALDLGQPDLVLRAALAVVIFCLLSGAVYVMNDLLDVEKDRLHPVKRRRPLASGELGQGTAATFAVLTILAALSASLLLPPLFLGTALGYLALQVLYVGVLKHQVILDVFALATGFVLRAVAGAAAVAVPISPWLYVCTLLLALFLALSKRRQELILLTTGAAEHRPSLDQYTVSLLDELLQVVTTSLLVAYMLYTFFAENLPKNHAMMLTIPFVLYGLFRYLYLVHARGEGGSPEDVLLRDRPTAICVALWVVSTVAILYLSPRA